jgi:formate dehydrogenase major subunit
VASEWGWAWPANRRVLYNRASADPDGRPWSERKALVWWDAQAGKWAGHDVPDFVADRPPSYRPPDGATGVAAISGTDPFIMQADGKAWLFSPAGLVDGPLPAHYEPQESPLPNLLYAQQHNPVRQIIAHPEDRFQPSGAEPGSGVFPYVVTTYRLTEHHTAGGMSRFLPYLAELQPAFFCEVSPELAAERGLAHLGWATVISARSAIEARVMVTRRMKPLWAGGRPVHQIGLPWHWGPNGLTTGDAANELAHLALDPNVHIQEVKAMAVDIQPGRRPRGPELRDLIRSYQERRRGGRDRGVRGGAGSRSGPAGAVPEHAADDQAQLADERRHVGDHRVRRGGRGRRGQRGHGAAAPGRGGGHRRDHRAGPGGVYLYRRAALRHRGARLA